MRQTVGTIDAHKTRTAIITGFHSFPPIFDHSFLAMPTVRSAIVHHQPTPIIWNVLTNLNGVQLNYHCAICLERNSSSAELPPIPLPPSLLLNSGIRELRRNTVG